MHVKYHSVSDIFGDLSAVRNYLWHDNVLIKLLYNSMVRENFKGNSFVMDNMTSQGEVGLLMGIVSELRFNTKSSKNSTKSSWLSN